MSDSNLNYGGSKSEPTTVAPSLPTSTSIDIGQVAANLAAQIINDGSNSNANNPNQYQSNCASASSGGVTGSSQIEEPETVSNDDSLTSISGLSIISTDSGGGDGDGGPGPGGISSSTLSYSSCSSVSCSSPSSNSTVSSLALYTQANQSLGQNILKEENKLSHSTPHNCPDDHHHHHQQSIQIKRNAMNLQDFERNHRDPQNPEYHSSRKIFHRLLPQRFGVKRTITNLFPIFKWMSRYSFKANFILDLIAGLTVLSLNIPEGLAYSEVGNIEPVYGLYVSIFPGIIYAIMGTSRHLSFGTFAVISLLCKHVIDRFYDTHYPSYDPDIDSGRPDKIELLVVLSLIGGVMQALIGFLRLGVLALVLSDNLLSSFMVGCAALICNGQLKDFLGLKYDADENQELGIPSEFINMWISTIRHLPEANVCATIMSLSVLVCLCVFKFILDPYLFRPKLKLTFPFPIDLVMVVVTTLISSSFNLHEKYDLEIVGHIPDGLHAPVMPRLDLVPSLLMGGIEIGIISSVITLSLVRVCAKTNDYSVSLNQEFISYGTANIFGSFLHCYPSCGSVSRTNVQETTGGKTQLVTLISSSIMIIFICFFTTYLEALPKATLSVIIIIALFHTFERFKGVKRIWTISKLDGFQWITTFLAALVLGIDVGIIYGVSVSMVIVLIRTALPTSSIKYSIPNSEIYLSSNVFVGLDPSLTEQIPSNSLYRRLSSSELKHSVIVFAFQGPLTFLSVPAFYTDFENKILEPIRNLNRMKRKSLMLQQVTLEQSAANKSQILDSEPNISLDKFAQCKNSNFTLADQLSTVTTTTTVTDSNNNGNGAVAGVDESCDSKLCLVFDLSQMLHIDVTGLEFIQKLQHQLKLLDVEMLLASLSVSSMATMERANFFNETLPKSRCFVSVHDAVIAAKHRLV